MGPALGGLPGNNIASSEGFAYSGALSSKATIKWTDGNLDKWLKSPSGFAPGNAMAFAGIGNAKDRADIIAYLKGGWAQQKRKSKTKESLAMTFKVSYSKYLIRER